MDRHVIVAMTILHGNAYVTRLGQIKSNPKIQAVLNPKEEHARVHEVFRNLNDEHSVAFKQDLGCPVGDEAELKVKSDLKTCCWKTTY